MGPLYKQGCPFLAAVAQQLVMDGAGDARASPLRFDHDLGQAKGATACLVGQAVICDRGTQRRPPRLARSQRVSVGIADDLTINFADYRLPVRRGGVVLEPVLEALNREERVRGYLLGVDLGVHVDQGGPDLVELTKRV